MEGPGSIAAMLLEHIPGSAGVLLPVCSHCCRRRPPPPRCPACRDDRSIHVMFFRLILRADLDCNAAERLHGRRGSDLQGARRAWEECNSNQSCHYRHCRRPPPPMPFDRCAHFASRMCGSSDSSLQIVLIADEVMTGFGRTGKMFGFQHFDVQPDIVTFAKGISVSGVGGRRLDARWPLRPPAMVDDGVMTGLGSVCTPDFLLLVYVCVYVCVPLCLHCDAGIMASSGECLEYLQCSRSSNGFH